MYNLLTSHLYYVKIVDQAKIYTMLFHHNRNGKKCRLILQLSNCGYFIHQIHM